MTFDLVSAARDAFLAQTTESVVVLDLQERVLTLNPAALRLLAGPGAASPAGQPIANALKTWPALLTLCQTQAEIPAPLTIEHPSRQRFSVRLTVLRDENGRPAGRLLILRADPDEAAQSDFAERRRVEEEIRRLKELGEAVVQHAAEGIALLTPNGRITFINPAGAAMLGYAPEELVGRHWTRVVPQDQWHIIEAAEERRARGEADRHEVEMLRRDEARLPVQISGNPRYDPDTGQHSGSLVIFTNILERKRTEGALRRQAEQLANLNRAMQALTITLDTGEVLSALLRELQQVVPFDSASVFEIQGQHLVLVGGRGFPNLPELLGLRFAVDDPRTPSTVVVRTRQPYLLDDAPAQYAGFQADEHAPARIRGWLGVPLIFGNAVIGMLSLDKHEPGFYTEHHAQRALAFAAQAAIAVHNARQYKTEQDRRLIAETLREVSQAMSASLDRERVLAIILDQLARIVRYDSASIMLLAQGQLEIVAQRGLRNPEQLATRFDPAQLPNLAAVLDTQRPVIIADCAADPRWGAPLQGDDYIQSWLGVPLISQGRVMGVLNLDKAEAGFYTEREAELAVTFASQAALAIDNARLYSAAQAEVSERAQAQAALHRRSQYLAALNETMLELSSRLDLDDILRSIVQRAGQLMGTDSGYIDLVDPATDRLRPKVAVGALAESLSLEVKRGEGLAGRVWDSGRAIVVNEYDRWAGRVTAYSYQTIRAAIGVPLKSGERVVGVLGLAHAAPDERLFDADAVSVLEQFAQLAAVALDNAQLFRLEQERADELHQANERLQAQIVRIEALQAQLREQAIRDYLTGLFNRRYLAETLDRELAQAIRDRAALSVVLMDIDHFKKINDTYGHRAGDMTLQALGNLLHAQTRHGDIACRYGGEEFVVVMPGASAEGAYRRAEAWRQSFEAEPIAVGAQTIHTTLSLGIAAYPAHSHLAEELLRLADQALYLAKSEGRNRTVVYGAELSPNLPMPP
jgi:diguanylate cyclase (GGDEF)-like protein/PAS domain S-box-containing protein